MKDKGYLIISAILIFAMLTFVFFWFGYVGAGWTFFGFCCMFGGGLIAHIFGEEKTKESK